MFRRELLEGLLTLTAVDTPFSTSGPKQLWKSGTFTLENSKTTQESFGEVTVYQDGKTHHLRTLVTGTVLLHAGQEPHPPHQHPEEEFMIVSEGTGEILAAGKTTQVGPGVLMYSEPNSLHGIKNTGAVPMRFYYCKWAQ